MATEGPLLLRKLKIWDAYGSSGWSIAGLVKSNILQRNRSHEAPMRYNLSLPPVTAVYDISILMVRHLELWSE
jgi:hypothetical protein